LRRIRFFSFVNFGNFDELVELLIVENVFVGYSELAALKKPPSDSPIELNLQPVSLGIHHLHVPANEQISLKSLNRILDGPSQHHQYVD
jgi:hypothetical protein